MRQTPADLWCALLVPAATAIIVVLGPLIVIALLVE